MQALTVLARWLHEDVEKMHAARRQVLLKAIETLAQHPQLSISALGRWLPGRARPKHRIKCIDRLIGNVHLGHERPEVYRALAQRLVAHQPEPLIIVDWSDATRDRRWQILRAALVSRGRSLTLYEEVHPLKMLGNHRVHVQFLHRLRRVLPPKAHPIILTDAGFLTLWFRAVETLGWSWVGRLRGSVYVHWPERGERVRARALYAQASAQPRALGEVELTLKRPFRCQLLAYHRPLQGRSKRTRFGRRARSRQSEECAARERTPWLLAASRDLATRPAHTLINYYRRRMQIEEGFRDVKSVQYGLGFELTQSHTQARIANLLLLGALALVLLWLQGQAILQRGDFARYQSNTRSRRSLSVIQLGRYSLAHAPPPTDQELHQALQDLAKAANED